jgi:transcription antitermination factor NusG
MSLGVDAELAWYALRTRARHEKVVARALRDRGVECFLPVSCERHRWADRTVTVEVPLFSTYLFVHLDWPREVGSLRTRGVLSLVMAGETPAPVAAPEIEALLRLAAAGVPLERHRFLRSGQRVRVRSGPFRGIEGTLLRRKGREKLVVNVDIFQQAAALTLDGLDVEAA